MNQLGLNHIYSDNLHVDKYIQCQYIQDLTVSFKPICKPFPQPTCKLINRIAGVRLLISSLPGSASRMHVESLAMLHDSTSVLKAKPCKLGMKIIGT